MKKKSVVNKSTGLFAPSKGELRKLEIVKAAIECIATLGYERTNYETIGQLIGMQRPHVAYHFPDKAVLFDAAVRYVYGIGRDMVEEAMSQADPEWKQLLKAYVYTTYKWLESDKSFGSVITLAFYLSAIDAGYKRMSTDVREAGRERIGKILKSCQDLTPTQRTTLACSMHDLLVADCLAWLTCVRPCGRDAFAERTYKKMLSLK